MTARAVVNYSAKISTPTGTGLLQRKCACIDRAETGSPDEQCDEHRSWQRHAAGRGAIQAPSALEEHPVDLAGLRLSNPAIAEDFSHVPVHNHGVPTNPAQPITKIHACQQESFRPPHNDSTPEVVAADNMPAHVQHLSEASGSDADAASVSSPNTPTDDTYSSGNQVIARLHAPPARGTKPPQQALSAAERRCQLNFGDVVLHDDPLSRASANSLAANAASKRPLPGVVQAKLAVGGINEALEYEADAVADKVMRMADPTPSILAAPPQVSRKCAACEEETEQKLQTKPAGAPTHAGGVPPIVQEVVRTPGQPLDVATRSFMERRFSRDFSGVRVHTDAKADQSARAVNALAYTVGRDVVFGATQYSPQTHDGLVLLAHELTHTIQQGQTPGITKPLCQISEPGDRYKQQAKVAAAAATHLVGGSESDGPERPDVDFGCVRAFSSDARNRIFRAPVVGAPAPQADFNSPIDVSEPGEPSEVDADRFADTALKVLARSQPVRAMGPVAPAARPIAPARTLTTLHTASPHGQDPEEAYDEGVEAIVNRAEYCAASPAGGDDGYGGDGVEPPLSTSVGAPLAADLRERIEPLVGMDLARVRIHSDGEAALLAKQFEARAFAHQTDIFFASGAYAPGTRSGLHLLLHELAHVMQHSSRGPNPGVVAREPYIRGKPFHEGLEDILIKKHQSTHLIAEGVLPGATTGGKDLSKLGYPDLYRSSAGPKVPWVRGEMQPDGTLKYVPIRLVGDHAKHPPRMQAGKPGHEPTVDKDQNFTGDFPAHFEVGEIKATGRFHGALEKAGEALAQSANYSEGFPEFAKQAKEDGKTQVIPKPGSLTTIPNFLPPSIDYNNFKTDAANPKPAEPHLVQGSRRYWVYPLQRAPIFFYFDLPHPYAASDYTKALDEVFASLEGLKRRLGTNQSPSKVKLKSTRPGRARQRVRRRISRKTDWKAAHAEWEAERANWDEKKAKPYLKTAAAKAVHEKAEVDRFLNLPATFDAQGAQAGRNMRQVELFSGRTGKVLGDIRYALAPVFEKVGPFFEWLKQKFTALLGKFRQAKKLSLSWAQTIFDAVLSALGTAAGEAVSLLFDKFQSCIIGLIDNFVQGFVRDLTEELEKPFEEAKQAFFAWLGTDEQAVGQLITDVEASFKKYEEIVDAVMDVKRLVNKIEVYEWAIRGIVEAISCVAPPGFGCLWGLVAQIALPEMVDLAMTSDLFQDRVVRPLVRDLLSDILDEPFSRVVSASIEAIGLRKLGEAVPACHIKPIELKKLLDEAITPGLKLTDPALIKKRDEWEKAHEDAILDAAEGKFVKKDGRPATRQEIKKLIQQTRDLLPTAGTMQDAVANARRADGKIDYDKFSDWAQGKVAATPAPKAAGGFSADGGHRSDADHVKNTLGRLDLAKVSPTRLVELIEDSRDDHGNVNVDQLARKVTEHVEIQQLKRDIEAKQPTLPGVPKQPDPQFTDPSGKAPSNDQMRELVESLANANLGELSAAEKVEEARRPGGQVDVARLKTAVDAAARGVPAPQPVTPSPAAKPEKGPAQKKPEPKRPEFEIHRPETGSPFRLGPLEPGPQVLPGPGETPTVAPGVKLDFP
jgi:Domain of unknown function (DUF4157)